MLKYLHIKHFTLITELDLEFAAGLTVITGETGAGKSIIFDALEMVLGARADSSVIQVGHDRCELAATFSLDQQPELQQWFAEQDLEQEGECLIRRTLHRDGRSRLSINGAPCSLSQVRQLGSLFVQVHGQNQHSLLLKSPYQTQLLDQFAQHLNLTAAVSGAFHAWQAVSQELSTLQGSDSNQSAQEQLLSFQIQELSALNLQAGEVAQLEAEHQQLSHAERWITAGRTVLTLLVEDEDTAILPGLHEACAQLKHLPAGSAGDLLNQAIIQVSEAATEIRHWLQNLEIDPERLQQLDQRLSKIYDLARKYRVLPQELTTKLPALQAEFQQLTSRQERIAALQQRQAECAAQYFLVAQQLSASREQAAQQLSLLVTAEMQQLGMVNGQFQIQLLAREDQIHGQGKERIEFWVTANLGQPLQPLAKVASGGELSRISLAIQVITARVLSSATLIFDEVDVGVGGKIAEIVGQQLRTLAQSAQVFCITHLPQVAAQGTQHLQVHKQAGNKLTEIVLKALDAAEKVQEIARMLGGAQITAMTLAHAAEMCNLGRRGIA